MALAALSPRLICSCDSVLRQLIVFCLFKLIMKMPPLMQCLKNQLWVGYSPLQHCDSCGIIEHNRVSRGKSELCCTTSCLTHTARDLITYNGLKSDRLIYNYLYICGNVERPCLHKTHFSFWEVKVTEKKITQQSLNQGA